MGERASERAQARLHTARDAHPLSPFHQDTWGARSTTVLTSQVALEAIAACLEKEERAAAAFEVVAQRVLSPAQFAVAYVTGSPSLPDWLAISNLLFHDPSRQAAAVQAAASRQQAAATAAAAAAVAATTAAATAARAAAAGGPSTSGCSGGGGGDRRAVASGSAGGVGDADAGAAFAGAATGGWGDARRARRPGGRGGKAAE